MKDFISRGLISSIIVINNDIYLFAPDTKIFVYDNEGNKKKEITTILKTGFERPKPIYDPKEKKMVDCKGSFLITLFTLIFFSSKAPVWAREASPYYANKMFLSPNGEIYITFISNKIFGVIDAMIFNKEGKMIGYWKNKKKSYSEWFDRMTDYQKLNARDDQLSLAFYQNNIYMARTIRNIYGPERDHCVIQKYIKEEK